MNFVSWLISGIIQFFRGGSGERSRSSVADENVAGSNDGRAVNRDRNFDADFRAAVMMLKARMGNRFPDNFHARVGSETNSARDYGDERAEAIDTASAAIANALRNGASVKQAAEAGAASLGI
ncbi:hypothetical protein [Methylobacterium fujisawaense]|uniref:hypothetical protein n=1 Tax=Methylobacterium fujisawaense TaxID=107400 RepID=UPI00313C0685